MAKVMEPCFRLKNAGVRRDGRWLVRGIDLTVIPGEIVTLVGPNGSGKSTTARMALGMLAPDEGTAERRPDLVVGYVPQKLSIDWTLPITVRRFMRLTGPVGDDRIEASLAETGASHLSGQELRSLSGGEFQRVMLARAIARKPDLLVLDEPVQGVDYQGEIRLYELIRRIRDDLRCGILMISHDLHVVMAATDRVVCLNGHICCQGAPTVVASSSEYRALFGPRADATLALYEHSHNHSHDHSHAPDGRISPDEGSIAGHRHSADSHGAKDESVENDHAR